jgi:tRNA threonylcarbamoyladenosine biosynthesis protein TsaB
MTAPTSGPLWLALDAATYVGTVAVGRGDVLLAEREVAMRGEREERLMPAVAAALADAGVEARELDRVVCGGGPGSFTSLRIAAAIAKGIAAAVDRPLFAVPSLLLVVAGARPVPGAGRFVVALDAMRGDAYLALVEMDDQGAIVEHRDLGLAPATSVAAIAAEHAATVLGPSIEPAHAPRAAGVARLGAWLERAGAVDRAAWEPVYGRAAEAQVKWEAAHGVPLPRA